MSTKHSKTEQETVILYNQEDKTATISTEDPALLRKLGDLAQKSTAVLRVEERNGYGEYQLPKSYIKVSAPKQYKEETRQLMAERLRNARRTRKATEEGQDEADGSS